ncbi:MAG: hypothetical protein NC911_02465 [Candidatus Omnitrophica bacterium]|nr:hypothetical protein [Candidatus Omnitrophota bacterium]
MERNEAAKARIIMNSVRNLPFFSIDDIAPIEKNKTYLPILLSRYVKSKKIYCNRRLEKDGGAL